MSNMDIWDNVSKTDTRFTKHVNQRGGYTAISPQYQAKEATDQFGPYGKGWGLSSSEFDMSILADTGMVIHKAIFFYFDKGDRVEFPISNSITIMVGSRADTDWCKKVETNTISKALSRLGFNADVFMGMFEDLEYLNDLNNEMAIKNAADKEAEKLKQSEALTNDCLKVIEQINAATSLNIVEGLFKTMARRVKDKDKSLMIQLTQAKDAAKDRLNG